MLFAILVVPHSARAQATPSTSSRPPIPDIPAPIIETGLLAGDKLRPTLAWISDRDLLATTLIGRDSKFWESRVVRVDGQSGAVSEVIAEASVLCANPAANMAGLLVGSKAGLFTSGSGSAQPEPRVYAWNRSARTLNVAEQSGTLGEFNAWICRATRPEHRLGPMQGRNADIVYLDAHHGVLTLTPDAQHHRVVDLMREGRSVRVDLQYKEVLATPDYLPFRNQYLISAGSILAEAFYRDDKGEAQQESPITTMSPDGKVKRENFRGPLSRLGLVTDALLRPYAKGVLVIAHGMRNKGGGLYTLSTQSSPPLRRAWCVGKASDSDRHCKVEEFSLSPDGCRLAFYAKGSDDHNAGDAGLASLKIVDLCAHQPPKALP